LVDFFAEVITSYGVANSWVGMTGHRPAINYARRVPELSFHLLFL